MSLFHIVSTHVSLLKCLFASSKEGYFPFINKISDFVNFTHFLPKVPHDGIYDESYNRNQRVNFTQPLPAAPDHSDIDDSYNHINSIESGDEAAQTDSNPHIDFFKPLSTETHDHTNDVDDSYDYI